jgi:hypothetical protein
MSKEDASRARGSVNSTDVLFGRYRVHMVGDSVANVSPTSVPVLVGPGIVVAW